MMWLILAVLVVKWTVLVMGYRALTAAFDATSPAQEPSDG